MEDNLSSQFNQPNVKYTWAPKNQNVKAWDKDTGQKIGHIQTTRDIGGADHERKVWHIETEAEYRGKGVATGMYGKYHEKNPDHVLVHHEEDMSSHAKRLMPRLEQEYPGKHKFVSRAEDQARRQRR